MRAVVQRAIFSRVMVDGEVKGLIGPGLMVLLGLKTGDAEADADYMMDKIANLRIFPDEDGKMNLSVQDIDGEVLMVSQFTLYGDARKGRRPSFTEAGRPEEAEPLFDYCLANLRQRGIRVETGQFGADMKVEINNDGPCTILLDSDKTF